MSSTTAGAVMSRWWMVSARPALPRASARFDSEPVDKSSIDVDLVPFDQKPVHQVDPMNPAPPVTSVRIRDFLARDTLAVDHVFPRRPRPGAQHRYRSHIAPLAHVAWGPMTEPATLALAATWPPSIRTESTTSAPAETTEPAPRTLRSTRAPAATDASGEDRPRVRPPRRRSLLSPSR
jgi:hypothetical protein